MTTLADFLVARIADDERWAFGAQRQHPIYEVEEDGFIEFVNLAVNEGGSAVVYEFIHRMNPMRVLAECEAKQRIVALHNLDETGVDRECGELERNWPCMTLRFLLLPYADHPDYREEWRP